MHSEKHSWKITLPPSKNPATLRLRSLDANAGRPARSIASALQRITANIICLKNRGRNGEREGRDTTAFNGEGILSQAKGRFQRETSTWQGREGRTKIEDDHPQRKRGGGRS